MLTYAFSELNSTSCDSPLFTCAAKSEDGLYTLTLIKGKAYNKQIKFSAYFVLTHEQLFFVAENKERINLSHFKENIVYFKRGFVITEEEHNNALEYFAKHYSGDESKRHSLKFK